jgi:hypothetical protein
MSSQQQPLLRIHLAQSSDLVVAILHANPGRDLH